MHTDVSAAGQETGCHFIGSLLVESLLPFVDNDDPSFDCRRPKETLVDPEKPMSQSTRYVESIRRTCSMHRSLESNAS